MKKLPLALVLAVGACTAAATAQTYRPTHATQLFLSGGGSPIKPLTLQAPTLASPYTLTFPANDGNGNEFLQTDGNGNLVWATAGSALLPFTGTMASAGILVDVTNTGTGDVAQFEINNAASTGNALTAITNGTGLAILANGGVQVSNGNLTLANTGTAGQLRLHEAGGSDYTALTAQDQSGNNITYTLPAANGSAGQVLAIASSPAPTSTSATLEWAAGDGNVSHNATLTGNGSSGSPLGINLGNSNTWTANQTFGGTFLITSNSRIAMTNSDNNSRDLRIQEPSGTGSQYIGIRAPNLSNNGNYVWPAVVGTVGQVLTIQTSNAGGFNDSASLHWTTPVTGLTLPYSQSASDAGALFSLTNTDGTTGGAGAFTINNASNSGAALTATTNGTGPAIMASGNLVVTGTSNLQGQIGSTTGNLQLADNVGITGDLDIGAGNFTVAAATGNTAIGGTLEVVGEIDAQGEITSSTGNVTVNDDLVLTNNGTANELRMHEPSGSGGEYTAFVAQAQANNLTYTLPTALGTAGQVLTLAASPAPTSTEATLEWAAVSGGTVTHNATLTGNGTSGSPLGINLGNSNTWTANQTFGGTFLITSNSRIAMTNSDNNARDLRMQEPSGTGTQYVGIRAPSVSQNSNYVWPNAIGSAGQVLTILSSNAGGFNDSATLTWTTPGAGSGWSLTGNSGTTAGTDFIGTTDNVDFVVKTNNAERMRVEAGGDVGIGTNNPVTTLDVNGSLAVRGAASQASASGALGTVTVASNVSYVYYGTSTAAFNINGFTGGTNGKILIVVNNTPNAMTLNNDAGGTDGILNFGGATTIGEGAYILYYDGNLSRWVVISSKA